MRKATGPSNRVMTPRVMPDGQKRDAAAIDFSHTARYCASNTGPSHAVYAFVCVSENVTCVESPHRKMPSSCFCAHHCAFQLKRPTRKSKRDGHITMEDIGDDVHHKQPRKGD